MSKRPASTAASCPSCTANFNTDVHMPYMGSCSHSICALCVNGKKLEICPVCNDQQAFAPKKRKKNMLAMDLLSEKDDLLAELDAMKCRGLYTEEETYEGEQIPAIVKPENRSFLAQIVHQLDPVSFLNLASSCKALYNFCFDPKNKKDINITYDIGAMSLKLDNLWKFCLSEKKKKHFCFNDRDYKPMNYEGYKFGFLSNATCRKKLRSYPFAFNLYQLFIESDVESTVVLRSFLAEFPVDIISCVKVDRVSDWVDFLQFLKDFHVEKIEFVWSSPPPEELCNKVFTYIFQNFSYYSSNFQVPERFILNATVPKLELKREWNSDSSIHRDTFVQLIMKFADSTGEIDWDIDCAHFDLRDALSSAFTVLSYSRKKSLPDERPLILVRRDQPNNFWVVRNDQQVMKCTVVYGATFHFTTCQSSERPRCVQLFDQKHSK